MSRRGAAAPAVGHIFNLGHGILPQTPPDHARLLVDSVRRVLGGPLMSDAPLPLYRRSAAAPAATPGVRVGAARPAAPVRQARGRATRRIPRPSSSTTASAKASTASAWRMRRGRPDDPLSLVHPPAVLPRAVLVLRVHGHHHEEARGRGAVPRLPRSARSRCSPTRSAGRRRVVQYHWGGGTPTYLTLAEMEAAARARWRGTSTCSPAPRSRSKSIRASPRPSSWRCCGSSGSTACRSACRTSRPKCRRPSTASSRRT